MQRSSDTTCNDERRERSYFLTTAGHVQAHQHDAMADGIRRTRHDVFVFESVFEPDLLPSCVFRRRAPNDRTVMSPVSAFIRPGTREEQSATHYRMFLAISLCIALQKSSIVHRARFNTTGLE